jgi:hypothetical protein
LAVGRWEKAFSTQQSAFSQTMVVANANKKQVLRFAPNDNRRWSFVVGRPARAFGSQLSLKVRQLPHLIWLSAEC